MTFTSLLAIAFGAFGTNSNGGVLYHNTISFDSGICCVGTINDASSYSGVFYGIQGTFDVDFYYVRDEDLNNLDLAIHFNSGEMRLYSYPSGGGLPTLVTFDNSSSNFTNFEDSILNEPNNNCWCSIEVIQTGASGTLNCSFSYYDFYTDEVNGVSGTYTNLALNSSFVSKQNDIYRVDFDLDYLIKEVETRMAADLAGFSSGYADGYNDGYSRGSEQGYNTGYSDGYTAGVSVDQTAFTIFNGILNIGMAPINVFLAMFNFSVFGINLSNFVMSLLTLSVTIWVVKTISGGGDDK